MSLQTAGFHCFLWPRAKSWLIGKDSDSGRDWGQEEKGTTEDEMAGWHHRLDGRDSEWTPGVGDGQGGLACCDSWGRKESDTTEQLNWTEYLILYIYHISFSHSAIYGHLSCFRISATVNNVAMNIWVHVCFWIRVLLFFGWTPGSGNAGPCACSSLSLRNLHALSQSGYIILQSCQPCARMSSLSNICDFLSFW